MTLFENVSFLIVAIIGIALSIYLVYLNDWDLDKTFFKED